VVAAFEAQDARALRVRPRDLDRVLHRLGARVREQRLLREVARRDLVEQLAQRDVRLVRRDERARVEQPPGLRVDRRDDLRRAVPGGRHADAAGEVDQRVAVDVVDQRALGAVDDDVGRAREPARDGGPAALEQRAALRARDLGDSADRCHGGYLTSCSAGSTSTTPYPSHTGSWM
jgi:hypothetical protein